MPAAKKPAAAAPAFKPGQTVKCTVLASPRTTDRKQTVERLMRLDPANRKALRDAQHKRARRMNIYNRGNRDWVSREQTARVVTAAKGATWTMKYAVELARDIASVEKYLKIEAA